MRLLPLATIVSILLCLGSQVLAEGEPVEHLVARREALLLGAKLGPGVALAAAPRDAVATLGKRASALIRPPVLTLGGGYRAGALTPGVELSVSLAQEVPLAGVGGARSGLAKSFARSVDTDEKRAELEGASRAAVAWIDALFAQELLRLREEGQRQADAILKTTVSRVEAGVAPPHELALARGEAAAALASVLDAEGMQVEALAELRFSIGAPATEGVAATGALYSSDEHVVNEDGAVRAAQTENPTLQLAVARAEQADREAQLTSAMLGPSLSLGATYVREGSGDKVLLGFVGFPIPFFDAGGFETARQRATQKTAESQVELTRAEAARDIRLALHDRHHWREVRDALKNGALAAFSEAFRLAQTQYDVGTAEIGTVILARQRLLGVQEQLAEVAARVQRADIALARATGSLLEEATR
jgi:cobalt-zinc-cadmium efflux system outer membrane protein